MEALEQENKLGHLPKEISVNLASYGHPDNVVVKYVPVIEEGQEVTAGTQSI
jgi:hypothetical protein